MSRLRVMLLFFSLCCIQLSAQTFTNVASQYGINFTNYNGWGGGVSFVDFNNDGYDDLSIGGSAGVLSGVYKNNISSFSALNLPNVRTSRVAMTILWADYDRDGYHDLFVSSFGNGSKLYRNTGNESFAEVTVSAGLSGDTALNSTAACWADINNDGWLDLYVGNYTSTPEPRWNFLYKNNGNGTFTNITNTARVADSSGLPLAITFFDYNNDGWQDIYVAKDKHRGNKLFRNNGNSTFTDVSEQSGTNFYCDGMGIAIADYDRNGHLDMYVTNSELGNGLFKNNGNGTFTNVAAQLGVCVYKNCWGTNFLDYNNDGYPDIYVCVSHGAPNRKNVLFRNNGNGTFTQTSGIGLDNDNFESFGCSIGDFDNNGYPDIGVVNIGDPFCLWKNSGGSNKWIKLKLHGFYSNKEGIGSRIETYIGNMRVIRDVECGVSYCSQNSFIQTIGAGVASVIDSIIVKWPSGTRSVLFNTGVNQLIDVYENPIGIQIIGTKIPKELTLNQNFPNPFNASTIIGFSVARYGSTTLEIYDLSGRLAAVLVNENLKPGNYVVDWNAENYSSGVYFYRLSNSNETKTNKMLLIK
jgi:VCBS repeat protein/ASPIC/UnbV protein/type IX secretion system substrate protein